jgi:hypothetical protein
MWTCIGAPIAGRLLPRPAALLIAPALGWAVHSTVALPVFFAIGMSRAAVIAAFVLPCVVAMALLWRNRSAARGEVLLAPALIVALVLAALVACAVTAGVLPKISAEGLALASPIFDHSKIAMIDEMARSGVPPVNPFYGGPGPVRLTYYYLWHFSAAELAVLTGLMGWETDAGLTWFTAFASLSSMMGFATWFGGRSSAAVWIVVLAATASMRPLLNALFGIENTELVLGYQSGFGGWLFQVSWAPQHVASATCAVLSVFLLVELFLRPRVLTLVVFALTMAAGFESSTWIGGITCPLAAAPIALLMFFKIEQSQRVRAVLHVAGAALLALLLISPFLYDQFQMTALRASGTPIRFEPYELLDESITDVLGDFAHIPAYWLIYLVAEFPAFYIAGVVAIIALLKDRSFDKSRCVFLIPFVILIVVSLGAGGMLVSTLGENNDLGWRAVLPAIFSLIAVAAAGLSRLYMRPLRPVVLAAVALIAVGAPEAVQIVENNIFALTSERSKAFAAAPELWRAVRRVAAPDERVANNPLSMEKVTPWNVNIGWALMANRRSCFANVALVGPLAALPLAESNRISDQFIRTFDGRGQNSDVEDLVKLYKCSVAVVTPEDGAWKNDPFAASPLYRLVDGGAAWRIYKVVTPTN